MAKRGRPKGEQRQGVCVYCGKHGLVTSDHVFPQVIFLVLDEQMITVASCAECNQVKSLGDRDLRNFMILDIGGSQHPDANAMAEKMLTESNVRTRNWLRKQLETAKEVDLVTETGVILGKALKFDFNMGRIMIAQEMVVRGLYYHDRGVLLPLDSPIDIQHVPWQAAPQFVEGLNAKAPIRATVKGKNVAWWSGHSMLDMPDDASTWFICYNNWVLFIGTTGGVALSVQKQREAHQSQSTKQTELVGGRRERIVVPRDPQGRPMIPPQ